MLSLSPSTRLLAIERLTALATAATAANPTAHHINVRTNFGAYSAALLAFGEPIAVPELVWENDLQPGPLAAYHDEGVAALLALASDRLDAVLDREIASGQPVEVTLKVGGGWVTFETPNQLSLIP